MHARIARWQWQAGIGLILTLLLTALSWAGGTTCITRYQADFRRLVTECQDGSRSVTRYERDFKRWRTEVTKPTMPKPWQRPSR
jgi:hypothetical protein